MEEGEGDNTNEKVENHEQENGE